MFKLLLEADALCDNFGLNGCFEDSYGEDDDCGRRRECEQVLLPDFDLDQGSHAVESCSLSMLLTNRAVVSEREAFVGTFEQHGLRETRENRESSNLAELSAQCEAVEAELRAVSLGQDGIIEAPTVTEVVHGDAAVEGSPEHVLQTKIVPNWQVGSQSACF